MECVCQPISRNKFVIVSDLVLFSWFLWLIKVVKIVIFFTCYHEYTKNFNQFGSHDYSHAEIPNPDARYKKYEIWKKPVEIM